ncbi:MAG: hypothetical protein B1H09_00595 [Gemmatimonadaceae bacterium 4484_173]|nr:MAG: hypothetical protein B1H09_00595 [Gemmatimonadaceae bacterium 4484_173]RKZ04051.1 MAG: hypothetical protein DRQ21_04070 [Candidatus Fermentibacteria bacterium]
MKIVLVLLAAAGVVFAGNPEQDFDTLLDAVYSADAESFQNCISTESNGLIGMMLMMIKLQPEDAVAQISSELGVEITTEQLSAWNSTDFIETILTSPAFAAELPPRQNVVVSGFETQGDSTKVFFNVTDLPQPFELLLVKEDGTWKLDQSVIQAEF